MDHKAYLLCNLCIVTAIQFPVYALLRHFQFLVCAYKVGILCIQGWNTVKHFQFLVFWFCVYTRLEYCDFHGWFDCALEKKGYLNEENMYAKTECRNNYLIIHFVMLTIRCSCFLKMLIGLLSSKEIKTGHCLHCLNFEVKLNEFKCNYAHSCWCK